MTILDQITQHPLIAATVAGYVTSAAVNAMPSPESIVGKPFWQLAYQWAFAFAHTLLNNVEQAAQAKYPQLNLGFGQKKLQA